MDRELTTEDVRQRMKYVNGHYEAKGLNGEVQYYEGGYHYCKNGLWVRELKTCGDLENLLKEKA